MPAGSHERFRDPELRIAKHFWAGLSTSPTIEQVGRCRLTIPYATLTTAHSPMWCPHYTDSLDAAWCRLGEGNTRWIVTRTPGSVLAKELC